MSESSEITTPEGPHALHVVGIGRVGAIYVEALLRTGEIEDQLAHEGARFAALVIDIGDEDSAIATDYARSFDKRLESRGIPSDRFHYDVISLPAPSAAMATDMEEGLTFLKKQAPGCSMPGLGDAKAADLAPGDHISRSVAKTLYADAYYDGERPLDVALEAFAKHVETATLPSLVMVCFSMAGGLGGGVAIDLSRHLGLKLSRKVPLIGVAQLPHSGDDAAMQASPALYATISDLDCMLNEASNAKVVEAWGASYKNPFDGGFFVINPEQSWQRLTAYTTTGEAPVRQRIKQTVTNRFVADSFMRLVVIDSGKDLIRALKPSGIEGDKEDVTATARNWTSFNVAKLTHPGVQVLPGEARSKWDAVIKQWIDFAPKYSGLTEGFKTDYAEIFIYASRNMGQGAMEAGFKSMVAGTYLIDESSTLKAYIHEFFDTLTAYANIVLAGVAKTDLSAFWTSQKAYEAATPAAKLAEHAWVIDTGVTLPAATASFAAMAGKAILGASCWSLVSDAVLSGKQKPPVSRKGEPVKLAS